MSTKESDFLNEYKKQVENKLDWLDKDLKQRDYEYLSDSIFEKTNVQLSVSTIKRIWSSSYKRTFQTSTLNALAIFLGYSSWYNFKELNSKEICNTHHIKNKDRGKELEFNRNIFLKKYWVLIIAIILFPAILFFLSIDYQKTGTESQKVDVIFTAKKSIKEGVPNTIIFNYDVMPFESDSIYIQLSWNPKEQEKIDKNNHYYTCTYYYPGYHHAKLLVDNDIVKEHNIHIITKDWLTLVRKEPDDILPTYIRGDELKKGGILYASPDILKKNNVNVLDKPFYISYFYINDLNGLDGDDFSFETKIRIADEEIATICPNCYIYIYAENGTIVFPLSEKGCVSDLFIGLSNKYISGKTNDFTALGCDLTKWRKIQGVIKDKILRISIDDKVVMELSYINSLGKIKGWHYFFKGIGMVDNLKLFDADENLIFDENFEEHK